MSGSASRSDVALDQWPAAQHRRMVIDLAATLDHEASLRLIVEEAERLVAGRRMGWKSAQHISARVE